MMHASRNAGKERKMSRKELLGTIALCGAILGGCCSADYELEPVPENTAAPAGYRAVAAGSASNRGYYLFNRWALYAGNTRRPNSHDYTSFRDNVRPDRNAEMLLAAMRRHCRAEKLERVEHQEHSWGYFSLWLVWRRTITTTAVGVRRIREADAAETAAKP